MYEYAGRLTRVVDADANWAKPQVNCRDVWEN